MEKSQVAFSRSVSETAAALLFFDFKENFSVAVRNSVTASNEKRKKNSGRQKVQFDAAVEEKSERKGENTKGGSGDDKNVISAFLNFPEYF